MDPLALLWLVGRYFDELYLVRIFASSLVGFWRFVYPLPSASGNVGVLLDADERDVRAVEAWRRGS